MWQRLEARRIAAVGREAREEKRRLEEAGREIDAGAQAFDPIQLIVLGIYAIIFWRILWSAITGTSW